MSKEIDFETFANIMQKAGEVHDGYAVRDVIVTHDADKACSVDLYIDEADQYDYFELGEAYKYYYDNKEETITMVGEEADSKILSLISNEKHQTQK